MQQDDHQHMEHIGFDEMGDAVTREEPGSIGPLLALAVLIALFVLIASGAFVA